MSPVDRILDLVALWLLRLLRWVSWRARYAFFSLSLLGKGAVLSVVLYAISWISAHLGLAGLARSVEHLAGDLLGIVLAGAVMRLIWTRAPSRPVPRR